MLMSFRQIQLPSGSSSKQRSAIRVIADLRKRRATGAYVECDYCVRQLRDRAVHERWKLEEASRQSEQATLQGTRQMAVAVARLPRFCSSTAYRGDLAAPPRKARRSRHRRGARYAINAAVSAFQE